MRFCRRGRALAFAAILASVPVGRALACTDLAAAQSSRWSLATEHGVSWLVTPCGQRFFSLGVNALDGGYPERAARTARSGTAGPRSTRRRRWVAARGSGSRHWGFNSAGGWSLPPQLRLPTIVNLELGRLARFHWFDPFDPATATRMMALARKLVAPYSGTPYRIGYFSDNEVGWWAGALFVFYSMKPADNFTKQRWVEVLRQHYGDDWQPSPAILCRRPASAPGRSCSRATRTTRMRPGGDGIHAVREWTGIVAEHYYALAEKAIRAADPDALYFGDRLPIYYDPAAVRAMARHVDAIATNYNVDAATAGSRTIISTG